MPCQTRTSSRAHLADDESHGLGIGIDELVAVSGHDGLAVLGPLHARPRVASHLELQHGGASDGGVEVAEGSQDLRGLRLLKQDRYA